jgi:hypothetical protein
MATDTRTLSLYIANDAEFRAWGQAIAAQWTAVGLVKTTDTGQIDWATVLRPGAGLDAGYEVYRFDDAFQATSPVFIRVVYKMYNTTIPAIRVSVGAGTNGAGSLTGVGVTSTRELYPYGSAGTGVSRTAWASGGPGRFAWAHGDTSQMAQVIVERAKDSAGVNRASPVYVFNGNPSLVGMSLQVFNGTASVTTTISYACALATQHGGLSNVGSNVCLSPHMIPWGEWLYAWPLTYRNTDLAGLVPFTATHLGGAHVFLPLGVSDGAWTQAAVTGYALAIPFE